MKKNKKTGLILILSPFISIFCIMIFYAVFRYLVMSLNVSLVVFNVVNLIIAILGMAFIFSLFILIPLGVYFLVKKDKLVEKDKINN